MPIKPIIVDDYLANGCGRCEFGGTPQCKVHEWEAELNQLRAILLASPLSEQIKWGAPCYTHDGKNILMLSALRDSVVVSFFRGAELADPENVLEKPGAHSRFARYIRFTNAEDIPTLKPTILGYVDEAIALEQSGKQPEASAISLDYPEELLQVFDQDPRFEEAFAALTPGRQRGYLIHFTSAKQSRTKTSRIMKSMAKIYAGKGWNER